MTQTLVFDRPHPERAAVGSAHADARHSTLVLVRHGESVANRERRFTRSDDEPLTETGVEQARTTARLLAASYRPHALYSSPFLRARQTARELGLPFGLDPAIVPELYEQSFGSLRGTPYEDYYPVIGTISALERWDHRPPGGESLRDVAARVGPALERIAAAHPGETVVVVSHGGVMAALRGWACGNFDRPPESTTNAGGYCLVGSCRPYRGPLPLFPT